MQITTAQLNEFANVLGITDKTVLFSVVLKMLMQAGVEIDVAFDMLFGEGAYKRFAGELYHALRAA